MSSTLRERPPSDDDDDGERQPKRSRPSEVSHESSSPTVPDSSSSSRPSEAPHESHLTNTTAVPDSTPSVRLVVKPVVKSIHEISSILLEKAEELFNEEDYRQAADMLKINYEYMKRQQLPNGDLRVFCQTTYRCDPSRWFLSAAIEEWTINDEKRKGCDFVINSFVITKWDGISSLKYTFKGVTYEKKLKEFKSWLALHLACEGILRICIEDGDNELIDFEKTRHCKASMGLSSFQYEAAKGDDYSFFGYDTEADLRTDCVCESCRCTLHPDKKDCLKPNEFWDICIKRVLGYLVTLAPESHQAHSNLVHNL